MAKLMEETLTEKEAPTYPLLLLMLSVMAETSTATVGGAVCVGGSRPTEVMELVVVMEVVAAEVEAEMFPLLMLSAMAETSTATVGGAVCVGGSRPAEVKELVVMVMNVTVAEVETETYPLQVLSVPLEADQWR